MTGRKIAFVVLALCLSHVALAQVVDLTAPLTADKATIYLFHMDDVAGGQIRDAVAGKTGTVTDALSSLGKFGGAMSCDGAKGHIDVPNQPDTAPTDGLTVECWVKFRGMAKGDIICRNQGYMLRVSGTVQAYIAIDGRWRTVSGAAAVPANRWTHLAITYDSKDKKVRIYIDGKLDVARVPKGITAGKLRAGDDFLRIGRNTWSAASSIMDGKLDELRISSVARRYQPLPSTAVKPVPQNTNLLLNPSFESGMHGWRIDAERNAELLCHVETGDADHGRSFFRSTKRGGNLIMSAPFSVSPGKPHTVSVTMRAENPCQGRLTLRCTGVGKGVSTPRLARWFRLSKDWQRISAKLDVPADWPSAVAYVQVGTSDVAKIDIDAVSVVVGDEAGYTQTQAQSIGINAQLPPHRTYMLNSKSSLPIEVVNTAQVDRDLTLDCVITDWLGRQVRQERLTLGPVPTGKAVAGKLRIPDNNVGWFTATLTVRQGKTVIKTASRDYNVIEPMKGVGIALDSPLAMNTHMEREPNEHLDSNLGMLSLCGVKWIRAWWGWGMVEKEPGKFDWTEYDRQFDAVHRAGMEILPILLRYYPAWEHEWAGKTDRIQRPPYDLKQWGNFVETTVKRYRGRVKVWEVWNEPVYTMDAKIYAALLKVTYDRIKKADPKAQVVAAGGGEGEREGYTAEVCQAGSARHMDIVAYHSYSALGRPFERMWTLSAGHNRVATKYGCTQRTWHTEQGSQADGAGYSILELSEPECAVNLVQSYLSATGAGVEKFFWFSAQTTARYGYAVFFENHTPRPRLVALNGMARLLKNRHVTGRTVLGDGKVACILMDGEADPAAALWNLNETVTFRLPKGTGATFTDMLCNPIKPQAGGEQVELRLGQPIYVLPGKPGARQFAIALKRAEVKPCLPMNVTASRTPDGGLEVALQNSGGRSLDVRVSVRAEGLFTKASEPVTVVDLAPGKTHKAGFQPNKRPVPGSNVPVTVTIEAGLHGIRKSTRVVNVQF